MPPRHPLTSRWSSHAADLLQHVSLTKNHSNILFSSSTLPMTRRPLTSYSWNRAFSVARTPSQLAVRARSTIPWTLPRRGVFRRFKSSKSGNSSSSEEPASLSQRLRKLSREYGWSALGVYLLLSALDFPLCFAAVQLFGVERIGHVEHVIVQSVKDAVSAVWPRSRTETVESNPDKTADGDESGRGSGKAEKKNNAGEASIWTQLALAYAIHKSFIFIRVPLTAAVTPKVVKVLRSWGWNIGKRRPKST